MTRSVMTVLIAMLLLAAGPAGKDTSAEDDVAKLQGTWQAVTVERGDGPLTAKACMGILVTFQDDTFTARREGFTVAEGVFKVNASRKPKSIDLVMEKQKVFGIYEVTADSLTICVGEKPKGGRPKAFEAK